MIVLTAIRSILAGNAGVTAKRTGGIHINAAPEGDTAPNIVLQLVSNQEPFTHQGATGLIDDRVRICARGATAREAGELGEAINAALQGYAGTSEGCAIQLTARAMLTSDYQEGAKVHRWIADYNVHWRAAP